MRRKALSFLLVIAMMLSIIAVPEGVNVRTALAATFVDMNQSQIVAAMGAGYNLGNQLDANNYGDPSETAWGNPTITQSFINSVKNAGYKTIRIPVSWMNKIGSAPNYTIDSAWMARVKQVVDYAINAGLYVIINVHHDGGESAGSWLHPGASDQTAIKAKFAKVWTQIATVFKEYDQHVIFESMNEIGADANYNPSTISTYYTNINAYNQTFVNAVRGTGSNNLKRWLLIPGWNTNIDFTVGNYGFAIPSDSGCTASGKRIMVSVHYYTPWSFCGDASASITQWGAVTANPSKAEAGTGEEYMESQIKAMYTKFVANGYPVVIGEYGACDKSSFDSVNTASRLQFYQRMCQLSKLYGCVPIAWDGGYNGDYQMGLFNRSTGAITQSAIINACVNAMNSSTIQTLFSGSASASNWGQAVTINTSKNGGALANSSITSSSKFRVEYTGTQGQVQLILQSWSGGAGWATVAPTSTGTTSNGYYSEFTYSAFSAAYGTNFSLLDAVYIGATNYSITVSKVVFYQ